MTKRSSKGPFRESAMQALMGGFAIEISADFLTAQAEQSRESAARVETKSQLLRPLPAGIPPAESDDSEVGCR